MSTKVDFNDPQVKKAVYSMYRNILGGYNQKANSIVSALPKDRVREDQGITKQIESMIRQSNQISGGGAVSPGGPMAPTGPVAPPPPPPAGAGGSIPSVRIPSEIPARKEPPAAIQNAMMTKDKKPFTYTPGGLDLSEIRSPRMQRRVSRNAHTEDSCTTPQQRAPQPSPLAQPLPPSALAAMQPQIAIPVFPPGTPPSPMATPPTPPTQAAAPPPPPPPPSMSTVLPQPPTPSFSAPPPPPLPNSGAPPPPPMMGTVPPAPAPPPFPQNQPVDPSNGGSAKTLPFAKPDFLADIQNRPPLRPVSQPQPKALADFIAEIPNHAPLRPVHFGSKQSQEPSPSPLQGQIQLKPVGPRAVKPEPPKEASPPPLTPPIQVNQQRVQEVSPPPPKLQQVPVEIQTKQQPKVQATPHVYIPPSEPVQTPQSTPVKQSPSTPTPSALNKSPAPWMSTQKQVQKEVPPWAARENTEKVIIEEKHIKEEKSSTTVTQGLTRIIPIQIEGREPPSQPRTPTQGMSNAQQVQMQNMFQTMSLQQENSQSQSRTRIIPIQLEASNDNSQHQNVQRQMSNPTRPTAYPQNKYPPASPQTPTSSISGDSPDGRQRQLHTQMSWAPGNPTQSRSFRVLQKITGSEDSNQVSGMNMPPGQAYLMNRVFPRQETAVPQYGGDNQQQRASQNMTPGPENNRRPDESEF